MRSLTGLVIGTALLAAVFAVLAPGFVGLASHSALSVAERGVPAEEPQQHEEETTASMATTETHSLSSTATEASGQKLLAAATLAAENGDPVDVNVGDDSVTLVPSDPAPITGGSCRSVQVRASKGEPYDVLTFCNRGKGWRQSGSSADR